METGLARRGVNNAFYDELGEEWYAGGDHPIAILRAEAAHRTPWIVSEIHEAFRDTSSTGPTPVRVLDVGCGAGFLANPLSNAGFDVAGIDVSVSSLKTGRAHDQSGATRYVAADGRRMPFADASFDVVCALDVLEHVERADLVVAEAARVLAPGGMFFFHTFNRTWLSWLVAVKGLEWFVRRAPKRIHTMRLFIAPRELREMCAENRMSVGALRGIAPDIFARSFYRLLLTRRVPHEFRFRFVRSTSIGYIGHARKGI